ncbi:lysophospholipid acyltransferase family protein [Fluviispira vulneris]|uniref:lysophospholipid acyltransferase family protein n=1 Tax=Fluviispira vulneris TaxID=2763012 RepID=UPI001644E71E|nr:lysophospholipid acyltransferase family protein [Fluviispira vulneris]
MLMIFFLNMLSNFLGFIGYRGILIIAKTLGFIVYDVLRVRRKVILKNLNIAFQNEKSPEELVKIGRASTVNFIRTVLELLAADKLFKKTKVVFQNKEIAENIYKRNQGIYAMCIHIGSWDFLCHINSRNFATVNVISKQLAKGTMGVWIEKMRASIGYRVIDRKGEVASTTQIFNALDRKEVIGFIVDQKRSRGEMLPFFGKEASTNNSLAKLWLKKNAPIIPVIIKRKSIDTQEVIYFPEFEMIANEDWTRKQIVTENTKRMNLVVEDMIRQNPEEYFWMHNRWG